MTSADFLCFSYTSLHRFSFIKGYLYSLPHKTSSGKSNNLPLIYLPHLHCKVRAVLDFALYCKLVRFAMPSMWFLFVKPRFAIAFLQIPPHDGHPCPLLTVPTTKPVVDFHHQVIAHAEHTV